MSPGKSQVAIGFLRNTGTDPLGKGFNCSLREVRRFEICEICWRLINENKNVVASQRESVWSSIKYVDVEKTTTKSKTKNVVRIPLMEFLGHPCQRVYML